MSSYLEKYHLQKVEPVKNRVRTTNTPYRFKPKIDKSNAVKIAYRPTTPTKRKHHNSEPPDSRPTPKTEQLIRIPAEITQQQEQPWNRESEPILMSPIGPLKRQSLEFKSSKDNSGGIKIIASIQDFFAKITKPNSGCNCGDPCPHSEAFVQWADVPFKIVKDHYFNALHRLEESMKVALSEPVRSSSSTDLTAKSVKVASFYDQLKKNAVQIRKDVDRTQSENGTFQKEEFKQKLRNILSVYSYEDAKVGYVQGMNLILSGLLYHIKDQINTYAVFRKLIFSMRSIYLDGFKECYQHTQKIAHYLKLHVPDVWEIFEQLGVDLSIICIPWAVSLLSCIVPLQYLHLIYTGFLCENWHFFYKTCLGIIIYHKQQLRDADDSGDVLIVFSSTNDKKADYDWQDIIEFSSALEL